jgi:hypothetical protein
MLFLCLSYQVNFREIMDSNSFLNILPMFLQLTKAHSFGKQLFLKANKNSYGF